MSDVMEDIVIRTRDDGRAGSVTNQVHRGPVGLKDRTLTMVICSVSVLFTLARCTIVSTDWQELSSHSLRKCIR